MEVSNVHFLDLLANNRNFFEIPVFQRNYEWGKTQCKQLFNDLEKAVRTNRDHFIGTIVYIVEAGKDSFHISKVIDGQQRIMSLLLLLKAIANNDSEDYDCIQESYLTNKFQKENNHLKLKPVEYDSEAFFNVMNNKKELTSSSSKVTENYRYFEQLIDQSKIDSASLFSAINHFNMVCIELNSSEDENPQIIFESLNSTGVTLSPSDLVRNFLLMGLNSEEQNTLYKVYWAKMEKLFVVSKSFTEFVRSYLIMKTHKRINEKHVYSSYKDYYYNEGLNAKAALADLYKFAIYYYNILNANTSSQEMNTILYHINRIESKVLYPYFMLLIDMQENNEISWEQVITCAQVMENYLFRLKLCQMATKGLNGIVTSLCDKKKIQDGIEKRELQVLSNSFPTDKQMQESLLEANMYKQRNLTRLVLAILESYHTKETIDFDNAQIEHIMPQTLPMEWRLEVTNADNVNKRLGNTIGNLTLTKYNQEMSNKSFAEKAKQYSQSNILITRSIADEYQKWDESTITSRSKKMIRDLIEIFPRPKQLAKPSVHPTGEHTLDESLNVTNTQPVHLTINNNDYPVKSWRYALLFFLNYVWEQNSHNFEKLKEDPSLSKKLFTGLRRPGLLENGMNVETNFNANSVLSIIIKVAEIYDITDEVTYTLK